MWIEIFLLCLLGLAWIYRYVTKRFDEFTNTAIPFSKPSFPFGSKVARQAMTRQLNIMDLEKTLVENEFRGHKYFGYFFLGQPTLIINDEELAKKILIKDFDHFVDRRSVTFGGDDKVAQINNNFLTNLTGDEWKKVRSLMSGVFTSGKLRLMSKHVVKVGQQLEHYLGACLAKGEEDFETKELSGKFTLDAIATSGFGIESDSFAEPDNKFREMVLKLIKPTFATFAKFFLILALPWVANLFKISTLHRPSMLFFANIIEKTCENRRATGHRRNDIIDIMLDELNNTTTATTGGKSGAAAAAEKTSKKEFESEFERDAALVGPDGKSSSSSSSSSSGDSIDHEMLLLSNAIVFFFAGFDTTSNGISLVMHHLVKQQEAQARIIEEIDRVLGGEEGSEEEVTYEKIQEMKYLDMFLSECSRVQNIIPSLERVCTKDYTLPGTDYIIKKGNIVKVYPFDMSRENKYFKYPDEFNPENFAPENSPNKFGVFLFGHGPRNCIGMRYALITLKVFFIFMLKKYRLVPCSKTMDKLEIDMNLMQFKGGVWFKLENRH